jgi:hypothetical protein
VSNSTYLSKKELLRELTRRKEGSSKYIPHKPHPRQQEFLKLDCLEALFGGAVGGGKSDSLLMAALQHVHVPKYSALILRRTFRDLALPGAIMDRAKEWLATTDAKWVDLEKKFIFPSGASLSFGYIDNEQDKFRYASAEFQFIGFDELTQFPEAWYRFMFSRIRKPEGMSVPLRMRSATNPGGIGHEWVRKRFIDNPDAVFIPAKLSDNPSLDSKAYLASLDMLDPGTRRQLVEGLWVRDAGGLVYLYDGGRNLCGPIDTQHHILAIDFGFTDETGFCVLGWRDHDPVTYVVRSFKKSGMIPSAVAERVRELDEIYKFGQIIGDVGGLGKGYAEEARQRFGIPIEPAEKHNKRGFIDLLNGALSRGHVKLFRGENDDLIKELQELPWKHDRSLPEDGFSDHLCDALLYGWRASRSFAEQPQVPTLRPGSQAYIDAEEKRLEEAAESRVRTEGDQAQWMKWWGE